MTSIIYAILTLSAIGAVCAVVLILASKYMHVPVDEKFTEIRACLPGANCGACGFAGCDGYAQALTDKSEERANLCIPGADSVSRKLSAILGTEFEDVIEQVAFVQCMGDCSAAKQKYEYKGISSCRAANMLYNGKWECTCGCLGYGDCAAVCPNDAIELLNGIARVNTAKCSGCGLCAKQCPNHLIKLFPDISRAVVTCSNIDKGAVARGKCENACIACRRCEKSCPTGAVRVINNLAVINYDKCTNCLLCAEKCPTDCIKVADYSGIHRYIAAN